MNRQRDLVDFRHVKNYSKIWFHGLSKNASNLHSCRNTSHFTIYRLIDHFKFPTWFADCMRRKIFIIREFYSFRNTNIIKERFFFCFFKFSPSAANTSNACINFSTPDQMYFVINKYYKRMLNNSLGIHKIYKFYLIRYLRCYFEKN